MAQKNKKIIKNLKRNRGHSIMILGYRTGKPVGSL